MSTPEQFLVTDEMVVVGQTFIDAVEHVLKSHDPQGEASLRSFMATVIMKYKPYLMVTPSGVTQMMNTVWGNEGYRDFILTLSFVFFARWGQSSAKSQGLAGTLARGVAMVDRSSQDNAVPTQAGDRLADVSTATQVIAANKWLMIVLMIPLFCNVDQGGTKRQ